jgi:integration host factor subunit beta
LDWKKKGPISDVNKLELIAELQKTDGLSKSHATRIVELFFDEISRALSKGDRVEIRGLCSIFVKEYKAYMGRNPKSGERVQVKAKKLPFFKPGKGLRERVDGQG